MKINTVRCLGKKKWEGEKKRGGLDGGGEKERLEIIEGQFNFTVTTL